MNHETFIKSAQLQSTCLRSKTLKVVGSNPAGCCFFSSSFNIYSITSYFPTPVLRSLIRSLKSVCCERNIIKMDAEMCCLGKNRLNKFRLGKKTTKQNLIREQMVYYGCFTRDRMRFCLGQDFRTTPKSRSLERKREKEI